MDNAVQNAIQSAGDFQRLSRRTKASDPSTSLTRGWELLKDVRDVALYIDDTLDEHKKALFYDGEKGKVLAGEPGDDFILEELDEEDWMLVHGALGAATEVGEILEQAEHCIAQDGELDMENVSEEIGDTLYYLARLADVAGTSLLEIMQENTEKRKEKYDWSSVE